MRHLLAVASATLMLSVAMPAMAIEEADKAEIEKIVRDYLLANPEILTEMQAAYERKQQEERNALARRTIEERGDDIFSSPLQTEVGNPQGDVTVVEFFDYNCPYCARSLADMNELLRTDPNLRFVLKEVPIIRPESVGAHRVSLALYKLAPEKYAEFHNRLFAVPGVKTDRAALDVAREMGVDIDELTKLANDESIGRAFTEGTELAEALGISGTPSYVVGDEVVFGALGVGVLREKIANMRECGKTICS